MNNLKSSAVGRRQGRMLWALLSAIPLALSPTILFLSSTVSTVADALAPASLPRHRTSKGGPPKSPPHPFILLSRMSSLRSAYDPDAAFEGGDDPAENEPQGDDAGESALEPNWDAEETLLAMHLSLLPGTSMDEAYHRVSAYTQSFPYAAVLPVQPLQYLPTEDGGVELRFLRKKTHIKPGIDGGIRFFVERRQEGGAREALVKCEDSENENEEEEEDDAYLDVVDADVEGIDVTAKRNSQGQSLSKIFAEKLVVTSFVQGMLAGAKSLAVGVEAEASSTTSMGMTSANNDTVLPPQTRIKSPTADFVTMRSVFHKWM